MRSHLRSSLAHQQATRGTSVKRAFHPSHTKSCRRTNGQEGLSGASIPASPLVPCTASKKATSISISLFLPFSSSRSRDLPTNRRLLIPPKPASAPSSVQVCLRILRPRASLALPRRPRDAREIPGCLTLILPLPASHQVRLCYKRRLRHHRRE